MIEHELENIRYRYGDCQINILVDFLKKKKKAYELLFYNQWYFSFEYDENKGISQSIVFEKPNSDVFEVFRWLYGYNPVFIEIKNIQQLDVIKIIANKLQENLYCPILIDGYYDKVTEYRNIYKKVHDDGHGRLVFSMDEERIYYCATDYNDPKGAFSFDYDTFFLACQKYIDFVKDDNWIKEFNIRDLLHESIEMAPAKMKDSFFELGKIIEGTENIFDGPIVYDMEHVYRAHGRYKDFLTYVSYNTDIRMERVLHTFEIIMKTIEIIKGLMHKFEITGELEIKKRIFKNIIRLGELEDEAYRYLMKIEF